MDFLCCECYTFGLRFVTVLFYTKQLKECRELFAQLQRNLDSSWDEYYHSLCVYKDFYGDIDVPRRYIDANNLYLGRWLERQKAFYREGHLSQEQVEKLEELGCQWEHELERKFEHMFQFLCDYKQEFVHVNVEERYQAPTGENLGFWVFNVRARYRAGKIEESRAKRLTELGFVWYPYLVNWDDCYAYAKAYYEEHGNLKVPKRYVCEDGYKLALWLYTQRRVREGAVRGNLSEEQIQKLDEIGMVWSVERNDRFEEYVEAFIRFKEEYGTCKIPCDYVDSNGLQLGNWAYREKRSYREGKLSEYKVKRLTELGFLWNNYNGQWYKQYEKAKLFYEEHGHLSIPTSYTKEHGGLFHHGLTGKRLSISKKITES